MTYNFVCLVVLLYAVYRLLDSIPLLFPDVYKWYRHFLVFNIYAFVGLLFDSSIRHLLFGLLSLFFLKLMRLLCLTEKLVEEQRKFDAVLALEVCN